MRLRDLQRRNRKDLGWYLASFCLVQLGLALGVDRYWPAIRDPDFANLERIVRQRQASTPGRPLVLALGSSRTRMGLCAARLNHGGDPTAPVVVNCGVDAAGPMMYQVALRRLLDAQLRPELVFLEVIPMTLSVRDGAPVEERNLTSERFSVSEVGRVRGYYAQPYRLLYPWCRARALPIQRYQAELRDALALDVPSGGRPPDVSGRDAYGWIRFPKTLSPAEVEAKTRETLEWYETALTEPALAPGALQAYRDVVRLCAVEHIAVVLIAPPESSALRSYAPAVAQRQMSAVRSLARELTVPLIDASAWVDDDGFWDGHHTTERGAVQYTERFARDALAPFLKSRQDWTAATSVRPNGS